MSGLVAWLEMIGPRDQLRHVTGQLQELELQNARAGAFKITLTSGGVLHTFEFKNAHRLVALLSARENLEGRPISQAATVALAYYPFGRGKEVVEVILGQDNVLSYEDVASLAAENVARDRNTAIGIGVFGSLLIFLGGAALIARAGSEEVAGLEVYETGNEVLVFWLIVFALPLVAILAEPAMLHRKFGVEAFHLPIEYVLPMAIALLFFLPLWLAYIGLSALARRAMRDNGVGRIGLIFEIGPLWFFIYPVLFWIVFAAMFGGEPSAP
jgi:hypothetical protein